MLLSKDRGGRLLVFAFNCPSLTWGSTSESYRFMKDAAHFAMVMIIESSRYANHIWSIDFVRGKLSNSRSYKMLNVLEGDASEALCV